MHFKRSIKALVNLECHMGHGFYLLGAVLIPETAAVHEPRVWRSLHGHRGLDRALTGQWSLGEEMDAKWVNKKSKGSKR